MAFFQTPHLWVHEPADGVAALVLDGPGKVNHLDADVLQDIEQALTRIEAEARFRLCVLRSKKALSFCHGVEPVTWQRFKSPQESSMFVSLGQRVCDQLGRSRLPTVAIVSGAALGGGLEMALACDWRVAVAMPKTQLGWNELDVGLLPAWGGIGRLIRLIGLERALQMLLGGRKLSARDARGWGLVDDIVLDSFLDDDPPAFVLQALKRTPADLPRRTWRQRFFEGTGWGRRMILRGAQRVLQRRLPDGLPAPWEILNVVRAEVERGTDAGRVAAQAAVASLAISPACQNLLRLHALRNSQAKSNTAAPRIKNIGILGATPLALHLAVQAVVRGCNVVLREPDEMMLGMAVLRFAKTLQEDADRGAMTQEQLVNNINRLRPTITWKNCDDLELMLDATSGAANGQRACDIERHVPADAVIATVYPWRPLADWQSALERPERAAALHFPAPMGQVSLVEILAGPTTSASAVRSLQGYVAMLGKTAVVVQEDHGGLVNRIWFAGFAETFRLLHEGVPPERIEQAMQRFGMAHGLLEIIDWLGVEEFALIAQRLQTVLGDELVDEPVIRHMLEQRWLGIKTGIGFYRDVPARTKTLNPGLTNWLRRSFGEHRTPRAHAEQLRFLQERIIGAMTQEATRCLAERVVDDAERLDLAMMLAGWAPHRGGPIQISHEKDSTNPTNPL